MISLDDINAARKLDTADILQNTRDYPEQVEKCWQDWKKINIPSHYANTKSVLILGMGGSAIGAALTANLSKYETNVPIETCRDYDIPHWVDKNTFVIAVSYSGNTEETLESFRQAITKTEKLVTISTGGALTTLGSQHRAVQYIVEYKSQPRAAIGFTLTSILAVLAKLRVLPVTDAHIEAVVNSLREELAKIDYEVPTFRNPAKILAKKLVDRIPIILGSGLFSDVAKRWKGHFNENAKTSSYFEEVPEMNHNALVGLEFPKELGKKVFYIILESKFGHPRNKLRQNIIKQILDQRRVSYESVAIDSATDKLSEMYQMILFGDFVAYYLAILNNIAPEPVKIIDFLKDKLSEKN